MNDPKAPYSVAVVVDVAFAALDEIARHMPVWIVDSPYNRDLAVNYWREHAGQSHTEGVTTFKVSESASPEDWCADVLSDVDLHHGEYSHAPPYSVVEVFGTPLSDRLRAAFAEWGFAEFEQRSSGFQATKS